MIKNRSEIVLYRRKSVETTRNRYFTALCPKAECFKKVREDRDFAGGFNAARDTVTDDDDIVMGTEGIQLNQDCGARVFFDLGLVPEARWIAKMGTTPKAVDQTVVSLPFGASGKDMDFVVMQLPVPSDLPHLTYQQWVGFQNKFVTDVLPHSEKKRPGQAKDTWVTSYKLHG